VRASLESRRPSVQKPTRYYAGTRSFSNERASTYQVITKSDRFRSMTMPTNPPPDFTDSVRTYFLAHSEPFGTRLELRSVSQEGTGLTILFRGSLGDPREYGARFEVPEHVGDAKWGLYADPEMEPDRSVEDWAIFGILLPLVEAFDTTDPGALPLENGVYWFDLREPE
jgi:hypothetical protein